MLALGYPARASAVTATSAVGRTLWPTTKPMKSTDGSAGRGCSRARVTSADRPGRALHSGVPIPRGMSAASAVLPLRQLLKQLPPLLEELEDFARPVVAVARGDHRILATVDAPEVRQPPLEQRPQPGIPLGDPRAPGLPWLDGSGVSSSGGSGWR